MTRSLMTGVSGLRAHQQQLDVIANNLANMNTIGFKSQMTKFSDLMYDTIRTDSDAETNYGGRNPQQVGHGVQSAQIARNFSQGALQATGELLDFAIQGEGFFVLQAPTGENVYSRAGSFTLDGHGNLVDPATGYLVQRHGDAGELTEENFGFQTSGDNRIVVPLGASIPGEETREVDFNGNLPANASPPRAEILSSAGTFETATGVADLTTVLDSLTISQTAYGAGDLIELSGTNPDGTAFSGSLTASGATMGDLVNTVNGLMTGATAALQPNGTLTITADETGDAFTSLSIEDAAGNVGRSTFIENAFLVTTDGDSGGEFETSIEVYDKRGNEHRINFLFKKQSDNGWNVTASLTDESGVFVDDQVLNLKFNEDGTYELAGIAGENGDTNIELTFDTIQEMQTIDLSFSNMNHMPTDFSMSHTQDGTPPGNLITVTASASGMLNGLASNGKRIPLAQMAVARFTNTGGLDAQGGNFYRESLNSGSASIGGGLTGGRGQVVGNQLETSNVDIAQEFTQLIVAQRGFSANARTITVADEVLEELTNIVR